jgi:PhnB protein
MNASYIQPYLFFGGRCEEAIEFYKRAVGAQVEMLMRYDESPEPVPAGAIPKGFERKVMHSTLRIGSSIVMASDGNEERVNFEGFSLSLASADKAEAARAFDALAEGGQVTMPLQKTFWSPCFGMLTDRFGMGWMISVATPQ